MGNTFGQLFRVTTFGESHGGGIGVVIDGCPPKIDLSEADIQRELDRRRPGQSKITTQRQEEDHCEILSGVFEGKTLGTPIAILVRNQDARPEAYAEMKETFRPSHADFTYEAKYGIRNWQGGGRASARETVGRVAAGELPVLAQDFARACRHHQHRRHAEVMGHRKIAREVLAEAGFDPNIVTLVAHADGDDTAQKLALRPEVKLIDFTGSTANGDWLEKNARQAQVYTEKAGVNQIVLDSTDDIKGVARNVAFSLALYTGQMCTAPQNIYIPRDGIVTAEGRLSFDQVAGALAESVQKLVGDPARAVEILGAVVNDRVAKRIDAARALGTVVLDSQALIHPQFPEATIRTPMLVKLDASDGKTYLEEWFGPIAFVIATDGTPQSLDIARRAVKNHGALTLSVYSTDSKVIEDAIAVAEDTGVALSINLTGAVFVNQSAAFSDFHGTGANPAANASLTDAAFVANRFRVVQHRMHVSA